MKGGERRMRGWADTMENSCVSPSRGEGRLSELGIMEANGMIGCADKRGAL